PSRSAAFAGQTWEWQGAGWSQAPAVTTPPLRDSALLASDPVTGLVLLQGGVDPANNALQDTWTWDGITWAQRSPATVPPGGADGLLARAISRGQLFLFRGVSSPTLAWAWNGTDWSAARNSEPYTSYGATANDPIRGRLVRSSGPLIGTTAPLNTYEW